MYGNNLRAKPLTPLLKKSWKRKRLVVFAPSKEWGSLLSEDAKPSFDLITYSYDGSDASELCRSLSGFVEHFALSTEMWGESLHKLWGRIPRDYEIVLFLNSDIQISYADINKFFDLVDLFGLDISQPALSPNSFYSHHFLLRKPGIDVEPVPFIEVMMPCLSRAVIDELDKLGIYTISGWGIDMYLFPALVERLKLRPQCVVHAVSAIHAKPVESAQLRFSNGKTASEECEELKYLCERM